jgi:hypothetical protein
VSRLYRKLSAGWLTSTREKLYPMDWARSEKPTRRVGIADLTKIVMTEKELTTSDTRQGEPRRFTWCNE